MTTQLTLTIPTPQPQRAPEQHCWRGAVPAWTAAALERLYGNLYATVGQFDISRDLGQAHTYAAYRGGELRTLLVFSLAGGVVDVFNEVICLQPDEIEDFAAYVFAHFKDAEVIVWRAVHVARHAWRHSSQQYDYLEDTWVALPGDVERYTAMLGKNARRNLRRYAQQWQEAQPRQRFTVYQGAAIDPALIDAIVALNHARMANQRKRSALDPAETARLKRLAAGSGLVGVITLDGQVCAGAISYRAGDNDFLSVLAHDPAYDRYSLGFLCCYQTICACIGRGGREFHFLWGRYDYKRTFLGEQRALDVLLLYRSRLARLRHAALALRTWWAALRRRSHLWLWQRRQAPLLQWLRRRR